MARYSSGDNITTISVRNTRVDFYKTANSTTWTVPAGVTCATFEIWGAGGGGGARCCCDCYHQGFGGGPGSHTAATMPVTPGDVYNLVIGQGGSNSTTESTPQHYACLGDSGGATYFTGPGVTTFCAGGGISGNNNCYQNCLCSSCCGQGSHNSCILTSYASALISCGSAGPQINVCNDGVSGSRNSMSGVGPYSDAQGRYYPSWSGGGAWANARLSPINICRTYYESCAYMDCSMWGQPGNGGFSNTCCQCNLAGSGRNGAIRIQY